MSSSLQAIVPVNGVGRKVFLQGVELIAGQAFARPQRANGQDAVRRALSGLIPLQMNIPHPRGAVWS